MLQIASCCVRLHRVLLSALVVVVVVVSAHGQVHADLDGDTYTSTKWRVSLRGPKSWHLSERSSYPTVLLWMLHRRPSARILFAAEELKEGQDSQGYASAIAKKLKARGLHTRAPQLHSVTGAYWMDFDDGKTYMRQALLVPADSRLGYSLTLSTKSARTRRQMLRAFDFALRSLKPTRKQESKASE